MPILNPKTRMFTPRAICAALCTVWQRKEDERREQTEILGAECLLLRTQLAEARPAMTQKNAAIINTVHLRPCRKRYSLLDTWTGCWSHSWCNVWQLDDALHWATHAACGLQPAMGAGHTRGLELG